MRDYASGKAPLYRPNFTAINRNKRNIVLDLQSPDGVAALRALADVVLENFRPDVMDRLGIRYEELRRSNPRPIYYSIAGFANGIADAIPATREFAATRCSATAR